VREEENYGEGREAGSFKPNLPESVTVGAGFSSAMLEILSGAGMGFYTTRMT